LLSVLYCSLRRRGEEDEKKEKKEKKKENGFSVNAVVSKVLQATLWGKTLIVLSRSKQSYIKC